MPSEALPSASNDYACPPEGFYLRRAQWNALFSAATGIGPRLRALEALRADLQAVIDAGTTQALAMVAENVAPQLAAVAATIVTLNEQIAAAYDAIAAIIAAGVSATGITETSDRVFVTPAQKAAIGDLGTRVSALESAPSISAAKAQFMI